MRRSFFEKRKQRVWTKKVKYDVRKNFADSRLRVKGRFVKKEDEELLRELMNLTKLCLVLRCLLLHCLVSRCCCIV